MGTRKRFTTEQIIRKLREAEVLLSKGQSIAQVSKQLGVTDQTYYRWRREYGGLKTDQARRLKALERENVSTSLRGSALRVSPHIYNNAEDMEALGRALRFGVEG